MSNVVPGHPAICPGHPLGDRKYATFLACGLGTAHGEGGRMMMTQETTWGPRERAVEAGVESLGDADLVAIVLGTGSAGV
ncbi:MAG TPA: UPF0758 domain-containing protein, partial [Polyangiaceae bacterium]|nr:UPF0758 domain-containing protein [Polyangiaceae bacterium]